MRNKQNILIFCFFLVFILSGCKSTDVKSISVEPEIETIITETEVIPEKSMNDDEYERSTNSMANLVSKEVFEDDKKHILQIIEELDLIMQNKDYNSWITYIEPSSLNYWESRKNLRKAAARLPVKGLQLNSLEDYFKYVFIQSRIGRDIDEIRYISDILVKAVQVHEDQDIVYYYFKKTNDVWKLHLPPIED